MLIGLVILWIKHTEKLTPFTNPSGDFHYWPPVTATEDRNKILFNKVLYDNIKSDC